MWLELWNLLAELERRAAFKIMIFVLSAMSYVLTIHSNCLDETIRMNGHIIGFDQEIRKLAFWIYAFPSSGMGNRCKYCIGNWCRKIMTGWGFCRRHFVTRNISFSQNCEEFTFFIDPVLDLWHHVRRVWYRLRLNLQQMGLRLKLQSVGLRLKLQSAS